jgi:hypothetical protein
VAGGLEDIYTTGTAAGRHGELYFAFRGPGSLPYLTTSTDHGVTWSSPTMVAAPGVRAVRRVAVAVRRRGEVGLAYAGTTDGAHFNGYITESRNVLSPPTRFWSASVNDPSAPLINAATARPSAIASSTAARRSGRTGRSGGLPLRQDDRLPGPAGRRGGPLDHAVALARARPATVTSIEAG